MGSIGQWEQAGQAKQIGDLQEKGGELSAANASQQAAQQALEAQHRKRLIQGADIAQQGALGAYGGSALDVINDISNQSNEEIGRIMSAGSLSSQSALLAGKDAKATAYQQARNNTIGGFTNLLAGSANALTLRSAITPKPFLRANAGSPVKNPLFP